MKTFTNIVRAMRPRQWIKNVLLFAGVVFSNHLGDAVFVLHATLGFVLFSMLSGAIYLVNDVMDVEADRLHPKKCKRPIAAGELSITTALLAAGVAGVVSLAVSFVVAVPFGLVALTYALVTVSYSLSIKHVVVLDVMFLALGFVLRAAGGVFIIRNLGANVPMTPWFLICIFFLSLFIAACKRRQEISLANASEHRQVLADYDSAILDQFVVISAGLSVMAYALYLVSAVENPGHHPMSLPLVSSLPLVVFGIFRYLFLVYVKGEGGEPERLVIKDKALLITALVWLGLMTYLHSRL